MNDQMIKETRDLLNAAANGEVPADVRVAAEQGVQRFREAYTAWMTAASAGTKALEEIAQVTQAAAQKVGEKVVANAINNTEVAFNAAEKLARAKTLAEVGTLQTQFAQDQFTAAGAQGKELFDISAKAAKDTTEALTEIANKAVETARKAA